MGRTKLYDPQDAIAAIKNQFWAKGFEGTSLQDLEAATSLPKQTLYREFGDKHQMYLKALGDYERTEILDAATTLSSISGAKKAFEALFEKIIDAVDISNDRRGCFLCNASADRTSIDHEIGAQVSAMLERWRKTFQTALGAAQQSRELSDILLAGYIGLRVLARSGLNVVQLRGIAAQMLTLIPANS
ncbi:MAG: TetR/AcrR family transcriptional regulator [Erythrobacter sp.]